MRLLHLIVNFDNEIDNYVLGVWFHWKGADYPPYTEDIDDSWYPYTNEPNYKTGIDDMYLPTFFKGMGNEEVLMLKKDFIKKYPNQWKDFLKNQIEQGKYIETNSCNH